MLHRTCCQSRSKSLFVHHFQTILVFGNCKLLILFCSVPLSSPSCKHPHDRVGFAWVCNVPPCVRANTTDLSIIFLRCLNHTRVWFVSEKTKTRPSRMKLMSRRTPWQLGSESRCGLEGQVISDGELASVAQRCIKSSRKDVYSLHQLVLLCCVVLRLAGL